MSLGGGWKLRSLTPLAGADHPFEQLNNLEAVDQVSDEGSIFGSASDCGVGFIVPVLEAVLGVFPEFIGGSQR